MTYLLLGAVGVIWSIIIYQIFSKVSSPEQEEDFSFIPSTNIDLPSNDKEESFNLFLNYVDPFFKKNKSRATTKVFRPIKNNNSHSKPIVKKEDKEEKPIIWPKINYQGIMKSNKTNQVTALMTLNGRVALVHDKMTVDAIEILKIYQDSIQLKYDTETKIFYK